MALLNAADLLAYATPVEDGQTPDVTEAAGLALETATALVGSYTRDRHMTRNGSDYRPGIRAVVLTVAARLLANPGQVSVGFKAGSVSVNKGQGFQGFTLAELATLDRYRKRAI